MSDKTPKPEPETAEISIRTTKSPQYIADRTYSLELEVYKGFRSVRSQYLKCEKEQHDQIVNVEPYFDDITQVCFECLKVRTTIIPTEFSLGMQHAEILEEIKEEAIVESGMCAAGLHKQKKIDARCGWCKRAEDKSVKE